MKTYKLSTYENSTVVEIDKSEINKIDFALCAQPRQTLKSYYDSCTQKPAIICNGGFFSMSDGATIFDYKDNGTFISQTGEYPYGMGITTTGELKYGHSSDSSFVDFVSAYPPLIVNSQPAKIKIAAELNYNARRTVLGYNSAKIFIVAIEGSGLNFKNLQAALAELGMTYAINLDGGGSTKILKNGLSLTSSAYNRAVDNVVAIYTKPTIIYRVQVGAYSKKENADIMCAKIRGLEGYAGAYVRLINGLYKVQVGAYSIKANAARVVEDLKSKGFNAFITT